MNTWAFALWPGGPFPRLLELIRSEKGEKFVLERNGYLEPALMGTTFYTENLTKTVMDAYRAPFPTPELRRALLCWSRDIPVSEADPSYPEMKQIEQALPQFARIPTQRTYPEAATYEIEDASHFVQEDAPDRIVSRIKMFLEANP